VISPTFLQPLSEDEFDVLADALEDISVFDVDGVLGVLHAVAIAPSVMPPSVWLSEIAPNGASNRTIVGLLLRLYNEVLESLNSAAAIMPKPEDIDGCASFAKGYAIGAALDPMWIGNEAHWSFAAPFAYLAGLRNLVPKAFLEQLDADPEARFVFRHDMGGIVLATRDSLRKVRLDSFAVPMPTARARVGRNDPCPCGSGGKLKRCCIDRVRSKSVP
jgi:uncharacterized protein